MKIRPPIQVVVIVALIVVAVLVGLLIKHLNGPRIVAEAVAPDGTEMCIVQRCNWSGEPFTTSFYYRKPGGPWGWFYFDHQDWYWGTGGVDLDPNQGVARIYRNGAVVVTFDWEKEEYTLLRLNRVQTGAQTWLPLGESPF